MILSRFNLDLDHIITLIVLFRQYCDLHCRPIIAQYTRRPKYHSHILRSSLKNVQTSKIAAVQTNAEWVNVTVDVMLNMRLAIFIQINVNIEYDAT